MYKDRVNVGSLSREPVNINWSEKPKVTKESPLVSESKLKRSDHGPGGRSLGPNRRYRLHMMIYLQVEERLEAAGLPVGILV